MIDGSGSIAQNDFLQMKDFVSTVMNQFTKSKTLVRANGEVREQPKQGCKDIATRPPLSSPPSTADFDKWSVDYDFLP